jgi:hypothetical protein
MYTVTGGKLLYRRSFLVLKLFTCDLCVCISEISRSKFSKDTSQVDVHKFKLKSEMLRHWSAAFGKAYIHAGKLTLVFPSSPVLPENSLSSSSEVITPSSEVPTVA